MAHRELVEHMQKVHPTEGLFSCDSCNYKSNYMLYLKGHKSSKHEGNLNSNGSIFKCEKCDFKTHKKGYLQMHVKNIHEKTIRYSCSNCDMKSHYKKVVQYHIRSDHKNSGAKVLGIGCGTCNTGENHAICFVKSTNKLNQRTTYNKSFLPLVCILCPFIPMDHRELVEHMKKVHPTEGLFSCDSCNYKSNYMPNLKGHKSAKHEGIVNECDLCEYKTRWRVAYSEHRRIKHAIFFKRKG